MLVNFMDNKWQIKGDFLKKNHKVNEKHCLVC